MYGEKQFGRMGWFGRSIWWEDWQLSDSMVCVTTLRISFGMRPFLAALDRGRDVIVGSRVLHRKLTGEHLSLVEDNCL
jgi:hypothetical protein